MRCLPFFFVFVYIIVIVLKFLVFLKVRPWNKESTKHRRHGKYYEAAWRNVLNSGATAISITSFNQWHEGTQIEPAKSASDKDYTYLDYEPEGPNFYLNLTKWWIQQFTNKYQELY